MQNILESVGIAKQIATGLVDMNANMHSGSFFNDYYLHKPAVYGRVKIKDFAKEFASAFNQV